MNISPDRGADTKTVPLVQTFLPRCWPGPGRQVAIEPSLVRTQTHYNPNDVAKSRIMPIEQSKVACQISLLILCVPWQ